LCNTPFLYFPNFQNSFLGTIETHPKLRCERRKRHSKSFQDFSRQKKTLEKTKSQTEPTTQHKTQTTKKEGAIDSSEQQSPQPSKQQNAHTATRRNKKGTKTARHSQIAANQTQTKATHQ